AIGDSARAVHIEIDPKKTERLRERWEEWAEETPLVILPSPYRSVIDPLLEYIDQVEAERDDDQIVVVLPEFVPAKWWEKILHNPQCMMIKFALLHKRNVVGCNVRYFLDACTGPVSLHEEEEGGAGYPPTPPRASADDEAARKGDAVRSAQQEREQAASPGR